MSTAVKVWISVLLLAALGYLGYVGVKVWRVVSEAGSYSGPATPVTTNNPAAALDPNRPLAVTWDRVSEVTLIERSGEPLPLKQFQGQVWVVNFFFATCPASSKIISANISRVSQDLADKDVTFLSISVDPQTDTPAVLREYAKGYNAEGKKWLFATGDFELIRGLCSDVFKIPVERKTHADYLVLVDRDGVIGGTFDSKSDAKMAEMKRKIDRMIAAQPSKTPAK